MDGNDRDSRSLLVTVLGGSFLVSHASNRKKHYTTFTVEHASTDVDECLEAHVFDFSDKNSSHRRFLERRIASKLLQSPGFVQDYSGASFHVVVCRPREDRTVAPQVRKVGQSCTGTAWDDPAKQLSPAVSVDPMNFVALPHNASLRWKHQTPRRNSSQLPLSLAYIDKAPQEKALSLLPNGDKVDQTLKPGDGQNPSIESSENTVTPERGHNGQCDIRQRRTGSRKRLYPRQRRRNFVIKLAALIAEDGLEGRSSSISMREPGLGFSIRHLTLPFFDTHLPLSKKNMIAEDSRCWAKYLQRIQQQLPLLLKTAAMEQQKNASASTIPTILTSFKPTLKSSTFEKLSPGDTEIKLPATKKKHPDADVYSSENTAEQGKEKQERKVSLNCVTSASFTLSGTASMQSTIEMLPLGGDISERTDMAWREILVWLRMINFHYHMNVWATTKPSNVSQNRPHEQDLRNRIQTYTMTQLVIRVQPIVGRMVQLAEEVAAKWERVVNGEDMRSDDSIPRDIFKPLWHLRSRNLMETPTVLRGTALRTDEVEGNYPGSKSANHEDLSLSGTVDS